MISKAQTNRANNNYSPYIIGLVARERQRRKRRHQRAEQAMDIAHQAAALLRKHYPVTRIRIFGSVLKPHRFYEWSDIDLAVEGLPPKDYLRAWALLNGAELKSEFEIDLVVQNECLPYIWEVVEQEGIDI